MTCADILQNSTAKMTVKHIKVLELLQYRWNVLKERRENESFYIFLRLSVVNLIAKKKNREKSFIQNSGAGSTFLKQTNKQKCIQTLSFIFSKASKGRNIFNS